MQQRILYIVGAQNSGSTLLDVVLGQAPELVSLGEAVRFSHYLNYERCNCGELPASCKICRQIVSDLEQQQLHQSLIERYPETEKEKRILKFFFSDEFCADYVAVADQIYRSVFQLTGVETLVDSSKNVSRALALAKCSEYDIYFIHLVRDCRGYINSRNTRAENWGIDAGGFMRNIARWVIKNAAVDVLLKRRIAENRYFRVQYEEFIKYPAQVLSDIAAFTHCQFGDIEALLAEEKEIQRSQIFEGPRRNNYRSIKLQPQRLASQKYSKPKNILFWMCGGFLSTLWGYDFRQSYLENL